MGFAAFAAVLYSLIPGGGPATSTKGTEAGAEVEATSALSAAGPSTLKLLDDFLDARNGGTKTPDGKPVTNEKENCAPGTSVVRFLIATVPDPLDSHLALYFDRALDAIQRAAGADGYVLDRLYLPWKKDVQTSWTVRANPPSSEDGWLTASPKAIPGSQHRRQPGVLLFRRVDPAAAERQLLLVFLVGETPTSGIQREAFSNALSAVDGFRGADHCSVRLDDTVIRILGPYFSGSTDSLKHALETGRPKSPVQIITGSATVRQNQTILRSYDFHATVAPDDALEREIFRYFKERMGVCPDREVAVFSEAATAYGESGAVKDEAGPTADDCDLKPALRIQFPLHVSQLRAAYQQDSALKNDGLFNRGPRRTLELPLEPPEKDPGDILPPQDPKMASVFAELALAAGIETIRREPIRMVGIRATDPRDVLFLARKIGEARANVVLFAFGTDAVYTHPDYQRFLRGMLVATSYPLFPPNQEWTGLGDYRVAFSGAFDEGVFNAATLLLQGHEPAPGSLLEYRAPGASPTDDRPPIWIVAVGRGGYWPVRYTRMSAGDGSYLAPGKSPVPPEPHHVDPPPGSIVVFVLVELAIAFLALLYVQGRRTSGKSARLPLAEELFSAWKGDAVNLQINRTYTACLFGIAFLVQAAVVSWVFGSSRFFATDAVGAGLTVVAVLCAAGILLWIGGIVVLEGLALRRESNATGWRRWKTLVPSAFVTLPVLGALLVVLGYQVTISKAEARAFFSRALDFTSGLTPVTPFLLGSVVLGLWAASSLRRAFLLEVQGKPEILRRAAESPPLVPQSFRGTMELYDGVMECLTDGATTAARGDRAPRRSHPVLPDRLPAVHGDRWRPLEPPAQAPDPRVLLRDPLQLHALRSPVDPPEAVAAPAGHASALRTPSGDCRTRAPPRRGSSGAPSRTSRRSRSRSPS